MFIARSSPGSCPICGAAHTGCTADSGPVTSVQLPARDGVPNQQRAEVQAELSHRRLAPVTTGTYRRQKPKR